MVTARLSEIEAVAETYLADRDISTLGEIANAERALMAVKIARALEADLAKANETVEGLREVEVQMKMVNARLERELAEAKAQEGVLTSVRREAALIKERDAARASAEIWSTNATSAGVELHKARAEADTLRGALREAHGYINDQNPVRLFASQVSLACRVIENALSGSAKADETRSTNTLQTGDGKGAVAAAKPASGSAEAPGECPIAWVHELFIEGAKCPRCDFVSPGRCERCNGSKKAWLICDCPDCQGSGYKPACPSRGDAK